MIPKCLHTIAFIKNGLQWNLLHFNIRVHLTIKHKFELERINDLSGISMEKHSNLRKKNWYKISKWIITLHPTTTSHTYEHLMLDDGISIHKYVNVQYHVLYTKTTRRKKLKTHLSLWIFLVSIGKCTIDTTEQRYNTLRIHFFIYNNVCII